MQVLVIWVALAIPLHSRLANRLRLKTLIDSGNYQAVARFVSGKSRREFPENLQLKDGPYARFPLELLDALPADESDWLREEGLHGLIESLGTSLFLERQDWLKLEARYPQVIRTISRQAAEFRSRQKSLDENEKSWLRRYDSLLKETAAEP